MSSARFGFKAVPNGVLIDADGTIRWAKYGGFSVDTPDDLDTVRRFFAGEDVEPSAVPEAPYELDEAQSQEVEHLVRHGHQLLDKDRTDDAVQAWQQALAMDPENLVIRKQIWAARYPERFHPTIDWEWQKAQLTAEREREIAEGICGPDGCPLPQRA